jgi:hypothetical protein
VSRPFLPVAGGALALVPSPRRAPAKSQPLLRPHTIRPHLSYQSPGLSDSSFGIFFQVRVQIVFCASTLSFSRDANHWTPNLATLGYLEPVQTSLMSPLISKAERYPLAGVFRRPLEPAAYRKNYAIAPTVPVTVSRSFASWPLIRPIMLTN